jgi:eukaryotic-like serine/threonine-protein kinase
MHLSTNQIINNRYRIVKLLAQGGFGAVYRAWDTALNRPCALKENLETSSEAKRQFVREAQILANLSQPNLPRVTDYFVILRQGQYLVMDFIEGQDLQEMLDGLGDPLPEDQVIAWIEQVCDALSYLHIQNPPIIHRDVKPANIKITPKGQAILVDFGIAKIYDPMLQTTVGARGITPGYSPPEQYGQGSTDARTDVYALGATLFALLTNQKPQDSVDLLTGSASPVPPVRSINRNISTVVDAAIQSAMLLDRTQRCQSAAEFKARLHTSMVQHQQAGMSLPPAYKLKIWQRIPVGGWVISIVILVLAIGFAIYRNSSKAAPEPLVVFPIIASEAIPTPTLPPLPSPTWDNPTVSTPTFTQTSPSPSSTPNGLFAITDNYGVPMVLVPAGSFEMGGDIDQALAECQKLYIGGNCERTWFEDEEPIHNVMLDDYYIDKYEVTNSRYAECVNAGVCDQPDFRDSYTRDSYFGDSRYDQYPVIYMSWSNANTYCKWRGARLPTEAEWEKAARGIDGRLYPWGSKFIGELLNFCDKKCEFDYANKSYDDGYSDTAPVGSYPDGASPYGALDMVGNVWEWVADWYDEDYYAYSPHENPIGPAAGEYRVVRGGSWCYSGYYAHSSFRGRREPDRAMYFNGFRCARDASP